MASKEFISNHPDILSELMSLAVIEANNGNIVMSITETNRALASVNRITTNRTALAKPQMGEQLPYLSMSMMMARVNATIASGRLRNIYDNFPKYAGFAYIAVKIANIEGAKNIEDANKDFLKLIPGLIAEASRFSTDYLKLIINDRNTSVILNEFHNFLDPLSFACSDIINTNNTSYETKLKAGQFISEKDEVIAYPLKILESGILTFK